MPKQSKKSKSTNSVALKSNRVREARESSGLTMKQLSTKTAVSEKTIGRLEKGDPTVTTVIKHRVAIALVKENPKFVFAYLYPNG